MKLKNSVKLSALSLSLVALAVTSCGGSKNNDAKKDEKVTAGKDGGETPDPVVDPKGKTTEALKTFDASKVKQLIVSESISIPQFGCVKPSVKIKLDDGSEAPVSLDSQELKVFVDPKDVNSFEYANGQVCTVKENSLGKTVPQVGATATLHFSLVNNSGIRAKSNLVVEDKEVIKAVIAVPESFTPPTSNIPTLETALVNAKQDLRVAEANASTFLTNLGYDRLKDEDHSQRVSLIDAELTSNETVQAVLYDDFLKTVKLLNTEFKKIQSTDLVAMGDLSSVGNLKADTLANLFKRGEVSKHLSALTDTVVQAGINQAEKDARQKVQNVLREVKDLYNTLKSIDSRLIQNSFAITDYIASAESTPGSDLGSDLITETNLGKKFDIILTADLKTKLNAKPKLETVQTALQAVQTAETALTTAKSTQGTAKLVTVAAGSKATIKVTKTILNKNGAVTLQNITKNDKVVIKDNDGKELVAEVVTEGYVAFTAPIKVTKQANNYKIFVNDAEGIFSVSVTDAVAKSILQLNNADSNVLSPYDLLELNRAYHASIDIKKFDNTNFNLTSGTDIEKYSVRTQNGSGFQAAFVPKPSETGRFLPNYLALTPIALTAFAPHKLLVTVDGTELNFPFYVGAKPAISSVSFNYDGKKVATNALKLAAGGAESNNKQKYCAELAGVEYTLGAAATHSVTDLVNSIKVDPASASKLTATKESGKWFICANKNAVKNAAASIAIKSAHDQSITHSVSLNVGEEFRTSKFAVVERGSIQANKSIQVTKANKHNVNIVYINSDDTPSNKPVADLNLSFELGASSPFAIAYDSDTKQYVLTLRDADAKTTSDVLKIAAKGNDQPHENSVITIPVTYTPSK